MSFSWITNMVSTLPEIERLYRDPFSNFVQSVGINDLPLEKQIQRYQQGSVSIYSKLFRDPPLLQAFAMHILSSLKERRIAVAGCSRGQEPYTYVTCFWNEGLEVDGYDINPGVLRDAAQGVYELKKDDVDRMEDCGINMSSHPAFTVQDNRTIVKMSPEARRRVRLFHHDLLQAPLSRTYEVISLSNVLMHFKHEGKKKILRNVRESMTSDGLLICEPNCYNIKYPEHRVWLAQGGMEKLGWHKQQMIDDDIQVYK